MKDTTSTYGNGNAFSRSHTPEDDKPQFKCVGCGFTYWTADDLSKKGYCKACVDNGPNPYYCDNCYNDWTEIGIPSVCPVCGLQEFYSEDRFVDDLIKEKQKNPPMKKFASIVLPAVILAVWSLI